MLQLSKRLVPFLITLVISGLYLSTMAPGLTWAFDSADGGDLITAIVTKGVPHPSGYPTYLLLAGLFVKILFFQSPALSANLFSVVCMSFSVFILYQLVYALEKKWLAAMFTSLIFGTFPLVWSQAIVTEIYALQTLFMVLILFYFMTVDSHPGLDLAGGGIIGLSLGVHLTTLFLFPLVLMWKPEQTNIMRPAPAQKFSRRYFKMILLRITGVFLGAGIYLTIPFRALRQAPVNWGLASSWEGFLWLVSGQMYHDRLSHFSAAYLQKAFRLWGGYMIGQMTVIGLSIAVIALLVHFRLTRMYLVTAWLAIVYSIFAILYFSPDSYVYLIPALLAFSVWIGSGCTEIVEKLPNIMNVLTPTLVTTLLLTWLVIRTGLLFTKMDLTDDYTAQTYATTVLNTVPENAIVLTKGDESMFSLWYFHFALGVRPDVTIISNDLFPQSWYRQVLKTTYKDLTVPDKINALAGLNPIRPLCVQGDDFNPEYQCTISAE